MSQEDSGDYGYGSSGGEASPPSPGADTLVTPSTAATVPVPTPSSQTSVTPMQTTGQRLSPTEADVLQQFATSAMPGSLSQMAPSVEKDLMTAKAMSLASHDILGAHAREIQQLRAVYDQKMEIAETAHKSATAKSSALERQHLQQIIAMQQSIQTANDLAVEKIAQTQRMNSRTPPTPPELNWEDPWATIVPPDLTRYSGNYVGYFWHEQLGYLENSYLPQVQMRIDDQLAALEDPLSCLFLDSGADPPSCTGHAAMGSCNYILTFRGIVSPIDVTSSLLQRH